MNTKTNGIRVCILERLRIGRLLSFTALLLLLGCWGSVKQDEGDGTGGEGAVGGMGPGGAGGETSTGGGGGLGGSGGESPAGGEGPGGEAGGGQSPCLPAVDLWETCKGQTVKCQDSPSPECYAQDDGEGNPIQGFWCCPPWQEP